MIDRETDPLARWLTLLAALAIALACGLAFASDPVEAPGPPRMMFASHPSARYSHWLHLTRRGFQRTWIEVNGRTYRLVAGERTEYYTRAATPGDRY